MERNTMHIGLIYDVFEAFPWQQGDPPDADAEFEPEATVETLENALRRLGHTPVRIGSADDLRRQIGQIQIDAAVNIAEGTRGRNREAYVPVMLEMAGIPYLGSDGLTLSLSLDKAWTKDLAAAAGVPTPAYRFYRSAGEVTGASLPGEFPLFVKPRYEGSSKGITPDSKATSLEEVKEQVDWLCSMYRQDALVESFVCGGGEFTVAVIGHDPPVALPALQRAIEKETRIGLHALDRRGFENPDLAYEIEGTLTPQLELTLQELSLEVFRKLECRDYARVDFRVDAVGQPWFLEINPLPTFAPDGTFAIIAELLGQSYAEFLADTLQKGFQRLKLS